MQARARSLASGGPWAGLVAAATAGLALLASVSPSPLLPPLPAGIRPAGWLRRVAEAAGLDALSPGAASLRGILLMGLAVVAFAGLCLAAWRGAVSTRAAVLWSLALIAVATLLPPLLSRDVYSYAAYGRTWAVEGANPYVRAPIEFPDDPFIGVVSDEWIRTPSVYGPAFTIISGGIVKVGGSAAGVVAGFKALAGLAAAVTVLLVSRLGERVAPGRGAFAAVLVGLNPVMLFHTVGGGHNDTLVALSVAAALALWRRHPLGATAALTLGALVKVVAVVPLALALGAVLLRAGPGAGRRIRAVLPHAGVAAGLSVILLAPFGLSRSTVEAFAQLTARLGWASPVRLFVRQAPGLDWLVRGAFAAAAVVVLVLLLRRLARADPRVGAAEAWGWGMLVSSLCAAYLLPWYAAWFLPALALTRRSAPLLAGAGVSALLALSAIPAEPGYAPAAWDAMLLAVHYVTAPVAFGLLVALLLDLRRVLTGPPA